VIRTTRRGAAQDLTFHLEHPDLLTTQLRALLRLAAQLDLRILVPMVTFAEEMQAVRRHAWRSTTFAGDGAHARARQELLVRRAQQDLVLAAELGLVQGPVGLLHERVRRAGQVIAQGDPDAD